MPEHDQPTRIVLGVLGAEFDRAEEARIISLAAAAVAAMAVLGNNDLHLLEPVLRAVAPNYGSMSEEARKTLGPMVEEIIACARARKPFVGIAGFAERKPS